MKKKNPQKVGNYANAYMLHIPNDYWFFHFWQVLAAVATHLPAKIAVVAQPSRASKCPACDRSSNAMSTYPKQGDGNSPRSWGWQKLKWKSGSRTPGQSAKEAVVDKVLWPRSLLKLDFTIILQMPALRHDIIIYLFFIVIICERIWQFFLFRPSMRFAIRKSRTNWT